MLPKLPPLLNTIGGHWQLLLIATLPGSILRLVAWIKAGAEPEGASQLSGLLGLATEQPLITLLAFPVLTLSALFLHAAYRDAVTLSTRRASKVAVVSPDKLSPGAQELLCYVSTTGEFCVEQQRGASTVFVRDGAAGPLDKGRAFYDETDPKVALHYRQALAELEQCCLVEPSGARRLLTEQGWAAVKALALRELEKMASGIHRLEKQEEQLLSIIASCQHGHNVDKLVVRRDGSKVSAVYGNGQTIAVAENLVAQLFGDGPPDGASPTQEFEQLMDRMPTEFIEFLPGNRVGNPFMVRVTDTGVLYLRHTQMVRHQ